MSLLLDFQHVELDTLIDYGKLYNVKTRQCKKIFHRTNKEILWSAESSSKHTDKAILTRGMFNNSFD